MATLVSPGVSVTVTDESFFIPASAPTVPLFFIATADEKKQADGITDAEGTFEYDVVRTVTSLTQSTQLYGVPNFLESNYTGGNTTTSGVQHHGDARNEYGIFALNQFLGIGNVSYVIRTNVNLNDNLDDLRVMWNRKFNESKIILENLINNFINTFNTENGYIPSDPSYKRTVTASELQDLALSSTDDLFDMYSFQTVEEDYYGIVSTPSQLNIYGNGYDATPTGQYDGFNYVSANINAYPGLPGGGTVASEFTPEEGGNLLVSLSSEFELTLEFLNKTSLGANDAARRSKIVTAFQASINSNQEIRSDNFEFNLVLCPNYYETIDELLALVVDIQEEALIIADTPMDLDVDGITNPSTGWNVSTQKISSNHVAYYYPSALASNLDGTNVTVSASGVACRTYAYNDNVAFLWFAPAGLRRGNISGITDLGYVDGILGNPTTFVPLHLNQGQRDVLYQYTASGMTNPLVFFPGKGFVVWGQKTSKNQASAMDRVNVSRLIKYIKRSLRKNTLVFVFEPNDQLTRDSLKAVVDNFLGDLIVKRGLYDFATVCDESNNTPDRIDRNELYIDVALKPVKAAEFIYIPIRIVNTGAEI